MERAVPKTSDEARHYIDEAIDKGDFETAEYYENEYQSLLNFEREAQLGSIVSDYYEQNELLVENMENARIYTSEQILEAKRRSEIEFNDRFEKIKDRQEFELNSIIGEWKMARENEEEGLESDFESVMSTAKLIASQSRFQEAISIRDIAKKQLNKRKHVNHEKIDTKYKNQIDLMMNRHELELQGLVDERNAEIEGFKIMQENCNSEAMGEFLIKNANLVTNITKHFWKSGGAPRPLAMQAVTNKVFSSTFKHTTKSPIKN